MNDESTMASKALRLEALRRVVNDESWEARCRLETALIKDTPDEAAWASRAMHVTEGDVTPEWTREGFWVTDHEAFRNWCIENGHARMEWVVDEESVLEGCDPYGGMAYFEGEQVPGVATLAVVPHGVSLHPTKTTIRSIKEALDEHLHQTAGNPAITERTEESA